jgi:hypothetical protein
MDAIVAGLRAPIESRFATGQRHRGGRDRLAFGESDGARMDIEKIKVRITENDKTMDVVVLSKSAHRIQVVLGEGVHSVKCDLSPTPNRTAFSGKALGREIVYERSPDDVQADLDRINPALKKSRPR